MVLFFSKGVPVTQNFVSTADRIVTLQKIDAKNMTLLKFPKPFSVSPLTVNWNSRCETAYKK